MMKRGSLLRLLAVAAVLTVALAGIVGFMVPPRSAQPVLLGTALNGIPAPDFHLRDQWNQEVSLSQFRGHPVVLTFIESHCTQLCPVMAETLRRTARQLGPAVKDVTFLAVSTDPEHDTPASVRHFSVAHGMLHRWLYLTSSREVLERVWQSYHLYVAPANASKSADQSHTSAVYLIDGKGGERVLEGGAPGTVDVITDLRILLGLDPNAHGNLQIAAPEADHPAPAFALRALDGRTVSLASLRGKVVIMNFWATWCTACKSEVPRLSYWYTRFRGRGLDIVGIDVQEGKGDVLRYSRQYGIRYPVVLDLSGAVSATYNAAYLPTSLVVDRNGIVRTVKLGALDKHDLATHIMPLLQG